MSRIGKQPIIIPDQVTIEKNGLICSVHGPNGQLQQKLPEEITFETKNNLLLVNRKDDSDFSRAQHGLMRTLIANMITGVTKGYNVQLEIQGVGYRAAIQGDELILNLGFSHPIKIKQPDQIHFKVEKNIISISGIDKARVGEAAAQIRALKKPEPYKGKGIRYVGEIVLRKAGKATKA